MFFANLYVVELDKDMISADPLQFEDTKKYSDRLVDAMDRLNLKMQFEQALENQKENF